MWEEIVHRKKLEFQSVEDAHRQLQQQLRQAKPTLVMLDDVWFRSNLENLLFEGEGYKILVTTRVCSAILTTTSTWTYEFPSLDQANAVSLFCFWCFGQKSVLSNADEHLGKQVQAECKGLKWVIRSSLHGEPCPLWEIARNKLLNGESIAEYHKEVLLKCLQTSIDFLDEETGECFMDLGSFPEDGKISGDALMDIWVYMPNMDWKYAFVISSELASRNLLKLTSNLRSQEINYGSASELYFSQQDLMQDLALYLAPRDKIVNRKRLLMPKKDSLPGKWELLKDQVFDAQIVSIQTGVMEEDQGSQMNFRQSEALVLNFSASNCFFPSFLSSMKKLKVLMVVNYGSKRGTVNDLPALSSLTQLRTICLESLHVPPLQEHSKVLQNLVKQSSRLCEGLGNMSKFNSTGSSLKLPTMLDFSVDHCCDLEKLSPGICDSCSIENWSITNCHFVQKLPDDMGKLRSLRMLRLSANLGLKEFPHPLEMPGVWTFRHVNA